MIEKFEYEGEWWLPEQPEQKIKGTLNFTPYEGASLHLIGSKQDVERIWKMGELKIIQGFSADGKKITLHNCLLKESTVHYPGMVECSFYASYVFVGKHFQKAEDIKFKSLWIRFLHLDDWVNISGFEIPLPKNGQATIRYKRPKDFHANISKDLKISISFTVYYPHLSPLQKEACIKQIAYLGITPANAKSWMEYLRIIYHIQNFLTLAIIEPVHPLSIEGRIESNKNEVQNKEIYRSVGIFYRLPNIPKPSEELSFRDMLFTFKDISKQFSHFLKNWFMKAELLKPVYDLYFGALYNPRMYLNNEFLNLVQAIESYHRRTMKNYELPGEQHQKRITEILSAVPDVHKEWLIKKLKHSNEPILRKRLREILESCPKALNEVIRNKKSFINKTVVTRHYWTHFDPDLRDQTAKNGELFRLVSRLRILLQSCLLKELGFSSESLEKLVLSLIHKRYGFLFRSE